MTKDRLPNDIIQLLEQLGLDPAAVTVLTAEPEMAPFEEAYERYRNVCRAAYRVTRDSLDVELTNRLLIKATFDIQADGFKASLAAMLLEMFRNYLVLQQKDDPEQFSTDLIAALDQAVTQTGHMLKETHDTRAKQSNTNGSSEPPETSG